MAQALPSDSGPLDAATPVQVVLPRKGRKPLRFKGMALCRTSAQGDAEITLWGRQDGRLAVSMRIGAVEDATVASSLDEASCWVETQVLVGADEPLPDDALALLARLEARLAESVRHERLQGLAGRALGQWPRVLDARKARNKETTDGVA